MKDERKSIKKLLPIFLSLLMVVIMSACEKETPTSQFQYYELNNGNIMIMKYNGNDSNVVIPEKINGKNVTIINDSAFQNSHILSITLPKYLSKIKGAVFANCTNLETVIINSNLTAIEQSAFSGCSSLREIEFPESLESIGEYTFANCTSLEKVRVSENSSISSTAFYGCGEVNIDKY